MSNGDKRSVHTDALETLGTIISTKEKRDAIHLAVEPVEALEYLHPGQHVAVTNGKAHSSSCGCIGIVDPFITTRIVPGDMIWLVIYPRMITSLRHVWTHPAFDHVPEVAEILAPVQVEEPLPSLPAIKRKRNSVKHKPTKAVLQCDEYTIADIKTSINWLSSFASEVDADYAEMMEVAQTHYDSVTSGDKVGRWPDRLSDGGKWEGQQTPAEFWTHFFIATEQDPFVSEYMPGIFSCSC